MTTPFGVSDAQIFLGSLLGSDDAAIVVKRALQSFDEAYDAAVERHILVPERVCIEFWVSVCLLDAVLNETEYESGNVTYQKAYKAVKTAFSRRKFLHRETIHDLKKIRKQAFDELLMLDNEDVTELAQRLHGTVEYAPFSEAVSELLDRMEPPLKRFQEAYE